MSDKPGLWHSYQKVEIVTVTVRHKKLCACGLLPEVRRLDVIKGAGRHQKTEILCVDCGLDWIKTRVAEAKRAKHYFETGEGDIRG